VIRTRWTFLKTQLDDVLDVSCEKGRIKEDPNTFGLSSVKNVPIICPDRRVNREHTPHQVTKEAGLLFTKQNDLH
jgi:hypothetical protein